MSSTQYIKIFNDTVLKQSILQGYETQRTDSTLGKFTMGELAFTRDTGRVFVGTYTDTDNKKSSDIAYKQGGLLVGNKYYGASKGGTKLTHYPTYNSSKQVYNGDYTFDVNSCSLILFDSNIKNSNTIDEITVVNKTLNKITNDIYNTGFIKMRILEPDNDTIILDKSSNHNVLKADFKFDRVADYFGDNWKKANNTIEIGNIILDDNATCNLPSTVKFNSTEITFQGQENISNKFPTYLLCGEPAGGKYNVSFKNFDEVINLVQGYGIKIETVNPTEKTNKPQIKISWDDSVLKTNPNPNPGTDNDPPKNTTLPDATQTPWDLSDGYYYSGVSRFSSNGTLVATETYGNTKIKNQNANDGDNVDFEYDVNKTDKQSEAEEIATLDFIKNNYIGGLYNIGLNYLKTPLTTFYTFVNEDDKEPTNKSISYFSGKETCIEKLFKKGTYTYTDDNNKNVEKDYYPRIIPSHAQSIIFQITGKGSKATFKCNNLTILIQTMEEKDITTVEVPLYVKMIWEKDAGNTYPHRESYKYFNITYSNCDVKLLGYRV